MAVIKKSKAGRKPLDDKKVQINLYVLQSVIKQIGKEKCRSLCYNALDTATKKSR